MVRRVVQLFYKEIKGLHQAAYVLALFAFGSQVLALVRDRLLAHNFGADIQLDLYYAAFRIPDLLFVLFASVLSVYVLIPFITRADEQAENGAQVLSQIFTLFLILYVVVAGLLALFAPLLVPLLFPGLSTHTEELVTLQRILLLQPLFLGLSSLCGVITQLGHRFVLYALSPLIYNLGIIFGITVLYHVWGLSGLGMGVVIGAIGHVAIQWPFIRSSALRFALTPQLSFTTLRSILAVAIPRALTLGMHQLVLLVLVSLASVMAVGSVAVFQFAFNLQSVPLAVIGVSYSVAAFPTLSRLFAAGQQVEFVHHITSALRHIIFWSVPAIVLIIVLRAQLVRVLLGSGEFDWADTRLTAAALALLVISLAAQAANLLLVRSFYATGRTAIPFWITFVSALVSVATALVLYTYVFADVAVQTFFVSLMRLDGVLGSEVLALALAYSAGMVLQMLLLFGFAAWRLALPVFFLLGKLAEAATAAIVGGLTAYTTLYVLVDGIIPETFIGIFLQGLLAGAAGLGGVVFTYYVLESEELYETARSFETKLFKTNVVAPEDTL